MGNSSLERTGEKPPVTKKGHDTEALGPSDSSDTGSDIAGAPGFEQDDDALPLRRGTTSDPEHEPRGRRRTAGPDIGDENLDSDSDSGGTGERASAGRDAPPPTDQQLEVIDAGGSSNLISTEDLQEELVEEDREFGDEAAPDVFEKDAAQKNVSSNSASGPARKQHAATTGSRRRSARSKR